MEIVTPAPDDASALPLQSHPAFAKSLVAVGQDARALAVMDQGRMLCQLVLIRRRLAGMFPAGLATRGPIWRDNAEVAERVAALRLLRRAGLSLVESDNDDPALAGAGYRRVMTQAHVAELDLSGSADNRLAAMHPKWRNALRKAARTDLALHALAFPCDPGHWLLRRETAQRRQRCYQALPVGLAAAYARINPGQAVLFQADQAGVPVAAMLMLRHGPVATYHIGWSGPAGRRDAAHHLLLARAADWLAVRGCLRIDLGMVDCDTNPGLAAFKLRSGAGIRPLGGSWIAVPGL